MSLPARAPETSRRWPALFAVAAAIVLAIWLFSALRQALAEYGARAGDNQTPSARPTIDATSSMPAAASVAARNAPATPWPESVSPTTLLPRTAPRAPAAGEVEICGSDPVTADAASDAVFDATTMRAAEVGVAAIAGALAAGDALERSVAARLVHEQRTPDQPTPRDLQAQIARWALDSPDIAAWWFARMTCGLAGAKTAAANAATNAALPEAPACAQLTWSSWLDRDPGNGAPWLWVATDAANARQAQALDDAMYRLSQSRFIDSRWGVFSRLLGRPELAPENGVPALVVSSWIVGVGAAMPSPAYQTVNRYCAESELRDMNRFQRCDDIAHLLVDRSATLIDLAIGAILARRLQWPPERVAALDDERAALQRVYEAGVPTDARTALGCKALRRVRTLMVERAEKGEVPALRARLAASGRSVGHWASEARRQRAAAASAAQNPASAPNDR